MKIQDVKNALDQYGLHAGYFRWKKESHIQELENFYIKINGKSGAVVKNRQLTDEEYLEVAKIILGKNTWTETASSITLGALANKLGGLEALKYLHQKEKLNAINLKLVEQYTITEEREKTSDIALPPGKDEEHGLMLAQLLELLDSVFPFDVLSEICERGHKGALLNKLTHIQQLVDGKVSEKAAFFLVLNRRNPKLLTDVLVLLNKNGLCDESNIEKLDSLDIQDVTPNSTKIALLKDILSLFAANDPLLMIQTNLTALFNLHELFPAIKAIAEGLCLGAQLNSANIGQLLQKAEAIEKGEEIKAILEHFTQAGWPIEDYWEAILNTTDYSEEIRGAAGRLCLLNLNSMHTGLVLDKLFTAPSEGQSLAEAVELLVREASPLDTEDLKAVLNAEEDAPCLARGIVIARKSPDFCTDARTFISHAPEYAEGLALAYNQLAAAEQNTPKNRKRVLADPENAVFLGLILQYLSRAELITRSNPDSQTNFEGIIENAEYWQGLHIACVRLAKKGKLNQSNLTLLLDTPDDAQAIAEILCEGSLEEFQEKPILTRRDGEKQPGKQGSGLFRLFSFLSNEGRESPKSSYESDSEESEEELSAEGPQ